MQATAVLVDVGKAKRADPQRATRAHEQPERPGAASYLPPGSLPLAPVPGPVRGQPEQRQLGARVPSPKGTPLPPCGARQAGLVDDPGDAAGAAAHADIIFWPAAPGPRGHPAAAG